MKKKTNKKMNSKKKFTPADFNLSMPSRNIGGTAAQKKRKRKKKK